MKHTCKTANSSGVWGFATNYNVLRIMHEWN